MNRLMTALIVVASGLGLGCPSDPGTLQPLFDEILGLPGFDHPATASLESPPEEGWPRFEMPVRNVGDSPVTIASATLTEPGNADFFSDPGLDVEALEPDDQAVVQFRYITPGGTGHEGTLTITSDASNAELVLNVQTVDYVPPVVFDAGPGPGPDLDAGPGPDPMADAGADDDAGN